MIKRFTTRIEADDIRYSIGPLDIFPIGHAYRCKGLDVQGYLDFESTYNPAPVLPNDILALVASNEYGQARILLTAAVQWIGSGHHRLGQKVSWRLYFKGRVIREAEILGGWDMEGLDDD